MKEYDKTHGSPFDRGSADAYYHRPKDPHWWPEGTNHGVKVTAAEMTAEQLEAYHYGYDNETDRKDWS